MVLAYNINNVDEHVDVNRLIQENDGVSNNNRKSTINIFMLNE